MDKGSKEGGYRDDFAVGEEVKSNTVVARFGDKGPGIEDALIEVPPVEDWIMVLRFVERHTKGIDDRVDYLLRDSHRSTVGSAVATYRFSGTDCSCLRFDTQFSTEFAVHL